MIPIEQWLPVQPVVYTARSPSALRKATGQFNVEQHARYKPFTLNRKLVTWCNIFRWDATRALGVEVPHWYYPGSGKAAIHHAPDAQEMTANGVEDWMRDEGLRQGWLQVSRHRAEDLAMSGWVIVVNWRNVKGHGHEALMLPDGKVIQAGAKCGVFPLEQVFPHPDAVTFWRHS